MRSKPPRRCRWRAPMHAPSSSRGRSPLFNERQVILYDRSLFQPNSRAQPRAHKRETVTEPSACVGRGWFWPVANSCVGVRGVGGALGCSVAGTSTCWVVGPRDGKSQHEPRHEPRAPSPLDLHHLVPPLLPSRPHSRALALRTIEPPRHAASPTIRALPVENFSGFALAKAAVAARPAPRSMGSPMMI